MPKQSIADLKKVIEDAPEMTAEHRAQMLALVDSLVKEVEAGGAENSEQSEKLRGAINPLSPLSDPVKSAPKHLSPKANS